VYEKISLELQEAEKARKYRLEELKRGSCFYSERLGLRFERFDEREGHLRFTFNNLDARDPLREFWFDLEVVNDRYKVTACEPELPGTDSLLKQLNETNDLGAFVRATRRAFKQLTL